MCSLKCTNKNHAVGVPKFFETFDLLYQREQPFPWYVLTFQRDLHAVFFFSGIRRSHVIKYAKFKSSCMVQFYLIPTPYGKPRDECSPSGPGMGNCLKRSCSGGRRQGKSKITPRFEKK